MNTLTSALPQSFMSLVVLVGVGGVGMRPLAQGEMTAGPASEYTLPQFQGLENPNTFLPPDNPLTAKKVELGRLLFFDKRLSKNDTIACASCHLPAKGFTDGMPVSTGINKLKGGPVRPHPSIESSAKDSSGMAGPIRWKINRSDRSSARSSTDSSTMVS